MPATTKETLTLNLQTFFKTKGIDKPVSWMMKQGISNNTAHKLLHGKFKRGLPMHHLAMICEKLWCTPNDLFIWTPKDKALDQPTHPLQALKLKVDSANLNAIIKKLSPDKIEELKKIAEGM